MIRILRLVSYRCGLNTMASCRVLRAAALKGLLLRVRIHAGTENYGPCLEFIARAESVSLHANCIGSRLLKS